VYRRGRPARENVPEPPPCRAPRKKVVLPEKSSPARHPRRTPNHAKPTSRAYTVAAESSSQPNKNKQKHRKSLNKPHSKYRALRSFLVRYPVPYFILPLNPECLAVVIGPAMFPPPSWLVATRPRPLRDALISGSSLAATPASTAASSDTGTPTPSSSSGRTSARGEESAVKC
jgi:hypothetical protein